MKKKWLVKLEVTDTPAKGEENFSKEEIISDVLKVDVPAGVDVNVILIEEVVTRKRKKRNLKLVEEKLNV